MQNKVEGPISDVIKVEKWIVNTTIKNDDESLHELVSLNSSRTVELLIERKNERIIIKKTLSISNDFVNKRGKQINEFKYEFKMFLMPMDIDLQETGGDSITVNALYCLYFDGFSKNKFYHTMRKIGEMPYLFEAMEKKFMDSHPPHSSG